MWDMPRFIKFFVTFLMCVPSVALAHPHIWVYTDVEVLAQDGLATGLKVHWNFDELYSASFMHEADQNGDRHLSQNELKHTVDTVFGDNVVNLFPFMHIQFHQTKGGFAIQNPKIWMSEDETLHYQFDIVLDQPVPLKGVHEIGFFDPEFYVSFEQNYDLRMPTDSNCKAALEENVKITIYDGLIHPETYTLNCES